VLYESGGYGKIGEKGTNDGQVGVWCSELNSRLGIECITYVVKQRILRRFGDVERKDSDDWVSTRKRF